MVSPEMIEEEPREPEEVPTVTDFSVPSWMEGTADPPTEVATTVSVSEPSAEGAKRRRLNVAPGDRASEEPPTLTIPSTAGGLRSLEGDASEDHWTGRLKTAPAGAFRDLRASWHSCGMAELREHKPKGLKGGAGSYPARLGKTHQDA
eukprot:s2908_g15.t1